VDGILGSLFITIMWQFAHVTQWSKTKENGWFG